MKTVVMPHLQECRDSDSSKQRLLSLKMVEIILVNGLCHSGSKIQRHVSVITTTNGDQQSSLVREMLEIVESLSNDDIVNVRLNVGRILCNVICVIDEDDLEFVIKLVTDQILKEETRGPSGGDRDVVFFAVKAKQMALNKLENTVN